MLGVPSVPKQPVLPQQCIGGERPQPVGVVDPNTNRVQLNNELRTAMQGVGVYTNPTTGNMYYRVRMLTLTHNSVSSIRYSQVSVSVSVLCQVPPGGLDARVVDDVYGGSQPPATQPTQTP
ncbi:hypothetical protein LINPERHAP2_LOCUS8722 [Linum perenne]